MKLHKSDVLALILVIPLVLMACAKDPDQPDPQTGTPTGKVVVTTVAGNGTGDNNSGASTISPINNPIDVVVDPAGNLIVSEYNRVKKVTPDGSISVLAGDGSRAFADGQGIMAKFNHVNGITINSQGDIFVADRGNQCIRKITPAGLVSTFAGSTSYGYADGVGNNAKFWEPVDVAADSQGNLYVTDRSNLRIRKISSAGVVTTLAGSGNTGYKDGPGNIAEFRHPSGLAVDLQGNVYVADEENDRIRKISPSGVVSTLAGSGARSYLDGIAAFADFSTPKDVAVDEKGNVYVTDNLSVIWKISPDGIVSRVAGTLELAFADGDTDTARFYDPRGLFVDSKGDIYVADRANNRIRKISFK